MVNFNDDHKITIPSGNKTTLEWFNGVGELDKVNVTELSDNELFLLRKHIQEWADEQLKVIDDEINNWQTIYCQICGEEDLAFRGRPFITWGMRAGYPLCPRHTRAYDRMGTPEAELIKQARKEAKEIKELFG